MVVLKKIKQEGDIEMYELDKTNREESVYASIDKYLNKSLDEAILRDEKIQDERATVEPGVFKKRVQLDTR